MSRLFLRASEMGYTTLLLSLLSLSTIFFSPGTGFERFIRGSIEFFTMPVISSVSYLGSSSKRATEFFRNQTFLIQESHRLKKEVRVSYFLKQENERLKILNRHYELLLKHIPKIEQNIILSSVISRGIGLRKQLIWVNQGFLDGAKIGDAVMSETGLLGQVIHITSHAAQIMLLTSPNSSIPVWVGANRKTFSAQGLGRADVLVISTILAQHGVKIGDIVLSSALGGVFPEGYPIGIIESIKQDPKSTTIRFQVALKTDFMSLNYAMILRQKDSLEFSPGILRD